MSDALAMFQGYDEWGGKRLAGLGVEEIRASCVADRSPISGDELFPKARLPFSLPLFCFDRFYQSLWFCALCGRLYNLFNHKENQAHKGL